MKRVLVVEDQLVPFHRFDPVRRLVIELQLDDRRVGLGGKDLERFDTLCGVVGERVQLVRFLDAGPIRGERRFTRVA